MRKSAARRVAERLFLTLRGPNTGTRSGIIEVHYPERFGAGRAVLGICLPLTELPLGAGFEQLSALARTHYPPVLDGDRRTLTLFIPCPHVGTRRSEVLRAASQSLEWAKRRFGFAHGRLVPGGSRMTMLTRLGALST